MIARYCIETSSWKTSSSSKIKLSLPLSTFKSNWSTSAYRSISPKIQRPKLTRPWERCCICHPRAFRTSWCLSLMFTAAESCYTVWQHTEYPLYTETKLSLCTKLNTVTSFANVPLSSRRFVCCWLRAKVVPRLLDWEKSEKTHQS